MYLSRRKFVELAAAAPLLARSIGAPVTAQEVADRIRKNIGVDWKPDTVDTFKAGDPSTAVTRIVTTSLASLEVLNRAVNAGANLIITCEPTFYSKADTPTPPVRRPFGQPATAPPPPVARDPVFSAKDAFLKKHNLVIFRLSDHWRLRNPDPFAQGFRRCARLVKARWRSKTCFDPGDLSRSTGRAHKERAEIPRRPARGGRPATARAKSGAAARINPHRRIDRGAPRRGRNHCRRSTRVGVCRVRARHERPRRQESSHPHRPHRFGRPRNAALRAMVKDHRS